jgi:hypothetical protein
MRRSRHSRHTYATAPDPCASVCQAGRHLFSIEDLAPATCVTPALLPAGRILLLSLMYAQFGAYPWWCR